MFNEYLEIEKFLTPSECTKLLKKLKLELSLQPAQTIGKEGMEKNVRDSSTAFIDNIEMIDDKLKEILKSNFKLKGFEVTGLGKYQFTEYKKGQFYDWHTDNGHNTVKHRYCSVVIQLNENYDEGYLEYYPTSKASSGEPNVAKKGKGNLIIFLSSLLHRVTPISKGVRYSLVNWVEVREIQNTKKTLI